MASWRPRQGHLRRTASSFRSFLGAIDYGDRGRLVLPVSQVDSCSMMPMSLLLWPFEI